MAWSITCSYKVELYEAEHPVDVCNEDETTAEEQETPMIDGKAEKELIQGDTTGTWVLQLFCTPKYRQALLV